MCGIAGILSINNGMFPTSQDLELMSSHLSHRGPDEKGYLLQDNIGLAHTRLSIIDLVNGKQPIHNEDQSIWVIFNGEIFNYIELRKALKKSGHQFYTQSDTEVIVHLYEEFGDAFVDHLNGQFAIAIWDAQRQRLILVRDRVGIVPLFYTQQNGRLLFASEIKALMPLLNHAPRLNLQALDQIFTFWSPLSPNTLFENVFELSPGNMLVWEKSKDIKIHNYWDWTFPQNDDEYHKESETELTRVLHDLLVDATQIRLRSDVPVGAYLSGGLDSSVLTSLIHHHSDAPLRNYSIVFDSKDVDESSFQRKMEKHLGVMNSRIQCHNTDIADGFMDTIWHTESVILRTAPVPMRILSSLVKQEDYKVVLTGEGSDEVFGGYDIFKEAKVRQFWAKYSKSQFRPLLLKRLYPYLKITSGLSKSYQASFFGTGLDQPNLEYFSHLPRWETTAKAKNFFSQNTREHLSENAIEALTQKLPKALKRWHTFNRGQYIEAKLLMAGYLLCSQGDRMLMANSVEGRFPFLDHRVIEFANKLPPRLKMKVLNEKYLLKMSMRKYLPKGIIKRPKQPYRAPDIPAFLGQLGNPSLPFVEELLSERKIKEYGYYDPRRVDLLLKKAKCGGAIGFKDNQAFIGILSTQVLHYLYIENYYRNFSTNKSY